VSGLGGRAPYRLGRLNIIKDTEFCEQFATKVLFTWHLRQLLKIKTLYKDDFRFCSDGTTVELWKTAYNPTDASEALLQLEEMLKEQVTSRSDLYPLFRNKEVEVSVQFTSAPMEWSEILQ